MNFSKKLSFLEGNMANIEHKEALFNDFHHAAYNTMQYLEIFYGVKGVMDQLFGEGASEEEGKEKFRASNAWLTLSTLYDYAIHGVCNIEPMEIVIDGSDVIKMATSENYWPCREWTEIVSMADGRYALDEGNSFSLDKLALLAKVDIRTVRNAVSAGELVTYKSDDYIAVDNASARRWLLGRRGFKPTVLAEGGNQETLENVSTPAGFGNFLSQQRQRLGLGGDEKSGKLIPFHPEATPQALAQLEKGVFSLSLDAVFPIADFYQLDRRLFLNCVMRVFFYEELSMLTSSATA